MALATAAPLEDSGPIGGLLAGAAVPGQRAAAAWETCAAQVQPAPLCEPVVPPTMPTTSVGGPTPTASRQGRDKQRYSDDGARLVAGCIPFRYKGASGRASDAEVLLISSRGGKDGWVFPKGGWEMDESCEAAALRETVEEAGVRGSIEHPKVGEFAFRSNKNAAADNQGRCVAHVFVMAVREVLEAWPELSQRQRRWMSVEDAAASCRHQWMRDAIHSWAASKGWQLLGAPGRTGSESASP